MLALLGACSGQDESQALGRAAASAPSSSAPSTPADPGQGPGKEPADPADSTTCAAVNNGIGAFNRSDFKGTVALFEKAVPLAQARDAAIGDAASAGLLEAVRYYADLAPEDYLVAAAGSPEFEKYKQITLGQCKPPPPNGADIPDDGPTLDA